MTELGFTWEIPTTNFILRFSEICDIIHILHVDKKIMLNPQYIMVLVIRSIRFSEMIGNMHVNT